MSRIYENAIRLSRDESAIKMMGMIAKRQNSVTFCSTDDDATGLVPEEVRESVAESFAGLAMCALHQGSIHQCVGYATSALYKHRCALPMVSCVRIMAVSLDSAQATMYITEMVLLPYYLRTNNRELYEHELCLWDPVTRASFEDLPHKLATTAASLRERYTGRYVVVKAKYKDSTFIEKLCSTCGKGANGEKVFSCNRCGKAYYCGKECQKAHWKKHKAVCAPIPCR